MRTAASALVRLWTEGRRCTAARAAEIAARIRRTQERNAAAARSHRRTALRRLHALGIRLTRLRDCRRRK